MSDLFQRYSYFLLITLPFFVGCSSTFSIGHMKFTQNKLKAEDTEKDDSKRGFLVLNEKKNFCVGNAFLNGGYGFKPRKPFEGETQSDYAQFLALEKQRAQVCAKVSLYCTTKKMPVNDDPAAETGNCFLETKEKTYLKGLVQNNQILCATGEPEYISTLHFLSYKKMGWVRDPEKWKAFCLKHRTAEQCDQILQFKNSEKGPDPKYPFPKWAVEILYKESPDLSIFENKGLFYSESKLDFAPACELLEPRY